MMRKLKQNIKYLEELQKKEFNPYRQKHIDKLKKDLKRQKKNGKI